MFSTALTEYKKWVEVTFNKSLEGINDRWIQLKIDSGDRRIDNLAYVVPDQLLNSMHLSISILRKIFGNITHELFSVAVSTSVTFCHILALSIRSASGFDVTRWVLALAQLLLS